MIATRFLGEQDYHLYGHWLREQSADSLAMYFGVAVSDAYIDHLIERIVANPNDHHFLVATIGNEWVGTIHLAQVSDHDMEFGVMVAENHRHRGIADELMGEAIVWIRNRGFSHLYLHCLNRNAAMKHLAKKHDLVIHEDHGDVEAEVKLPPPSVLTYAQEVLNVQKNIFFLNLKQTWFPFTERHG